MEHGKLRNLRGVAFGLGFLLAPGVSGGRCLFGAATLLALLEIGGILAGRLWKWLFGFSDLGPTRC